MMNKRVPVIIGGDWNWVIRNEQEWVGTKSAPTNKELKNLLKTLGMVDVMATQNPEDRRKTRAGVSRLDKWVTRKTDLGNFLRTDIKMVEEISDHNPIEIVWKTKWRSVKNKANDQQTTTVTRLSRAKMKDEEVRKRWNMELQASLQPKILSSEEALKTIREKAKEVFIEKLNDTEQDRRRQLLQQQWHQWRRDYRWWLNMSKGFHKRPEVFSTGYKASFKRQLEQREGEIARSAQYAAVPGTQPELRFDLPG
jgi:hypothetical protein